MVLNLSYPAVSHFIYKINEYDLQFNILIFDRELAELEIYS